jgi:ABC-type nitrate/sulfonate/bicarbonate transport system substrate-binding protein
MRGPFGALALEELWHARCPVPTPLSIAVQLGWVEEALYRLSGTRLRSLFETNDPTEPMHYHESLLPNSFRQGGSVPAIWARANGQQTRVIGLSWTDEYQAIIAMPQSRIRTSSDLRGRRIGIPLHAVNIDHSRAAAKRAFAVVLESEGLTFDDVDLIDLPDDAIPAATCDGMVIGTGTGRRGHYSYSNEVQALARGDVDAVYLKDARGAQAAHLLGAGVVVDIGFHADPHMRINNGTPRPLTVSQYLLDEHPDIVRCLLAQVVIAGEWAARHTSRTMTLIGREIGWSENWVRYAYGTGLPQHLGLSLAERNIEALNTYKNFLFEDAFLPADFDARAWVDPAPLTDVLQALPRAHIKEALHDFGPRTLHVNHGTLH